MMKKRKCGWSDLELSILGLGCWEFGGGSYWGPSNQQDTNRIVAEAVDYGINYFDTAEVYNDGRSEIALGKALRHIRRDSVIVGSKIAPSNCYPGEITRHCEASLSRLGLDYLDVYMLHWPTTPAAIRHFTNDEKRISFPPNLEEIEKELSSLMKMGKIRYFGISNFGPKHMEELTLTPAVNELPYNLLCRAIEFDCLNACRRKKIGIIGYMTLFQGILGKQLSTFSTLPLQIRRTRHFDNRKNPLARHGGSGEEELLQRTLAELYKNVEKEKASLPNLAIQWVLSNPTICCALVGSRNSERLKANVKAAEQQITEEEVQQLNQITAPLKQILGSSFDYYENINNDRT